MIEPSRSQFPTTAMELATANARILLESEPRPAFDLLSHNVQCTNPDAMAGQKNYAVIFITNGSAPIQIFDGRHWDNFPT